jgi:hypothetical protein
MYSGAMGLAHMAADFASGANALPTPKLTIALMGQDMVFTWPDFITGYYLQTSAELGAGAAWVPVAAAATILTNGTFLIKVPMTGQRGFYRVAK